MRDDVDGPEALLKRGDVRCELRIGAGQRQDGVGGPERGVGVELGDVRDDREPDRCRGDREREQPEDQRLASPVAPEHAERPPEDRPPRGRARTPVGARRQCDGGRGHGVPCDSSDSGCGSGPV